MYPLHGLILFVLITSQLCEPTKANIEPVISLNSNLIDAIVFIIDKYFKDTLLYISNSVSEKRCHFHHQDILSGALARIDYGSMLYYVGCDGRLQSSVLRHYNLWFTDSHKAFQVFIKELEDDMINAAGYFVIVLSFANDVENIQKILSDCWEQQIVNVVILVESTVDTVSIYSYFPFTQFHCRHVVPVIINGFRKGEMFMHELFPDKLANLYGCPVFVIAWHIPPFVYIEKFENGSSTFDGIEGNVLQLLAKFLNFSVNVIFPTSDQDPRGFIFPNGTAQGSFGKIQRHEADLTLGSYRYSAIRASVLGTTVPHYHPPMVIAIRSSLAYTSIEQLLYPFDTAMWLTILAIFVIYLLVVKVIRAIASSALRNFIFETDSSSPILLNMILTLIGGPTNQRPRRNFARFMLMISLLTTLVLRGTYQGALYQFIRMDMKKVVPNTLQSLAKQKYTLLTDPLLVDMVNITDLDGIVTPTLISYYDGLMEVLTSDKKLGFVCPRDFVTNFNNVNHGKGRLHIVRERLVVLPITIIFPKYSYLLEPVNQLLIEFKANGLIDYWGKKYGNEKKFADSFQNYPRKFTNRNLAGAFQIYCTCVALAILVFLVELGVWYLKKFL